MALKRDYRLRQRADFSKIYQNGRKLEGQLFIIYHLKPVERQTGCRIGVTVTKKIGGAVVRNRIRRLIHEAVRGLIPLLQDPVDLVIVARRALLTSTLQDISSSLNRCFNQAKLLDRKRR
jgi:ribonuclease P protein component